MEQASKKLILMIDDEADIREIFSTKLKAAGFNVETAEDGPTGIEKARQFKPDLILMDMKMPGMTGVEAIQRLRENTDTKDIKVAVLTSAGPAAGESTPQEDVQIETAYKGMGAVAYLKKTDDLDANLEKIKALVS